MLFLGVLVGAVAGAGSALPPAGIWPLPKSSTCVAGAGGSLSASFQLTATGAGATADVVVAALGRYKPILLPPSHAAAAAADADGTISKVTVAVASADDTLSHETDYSYTIQADSTSITARAASPFGVAYALESLSQLMDKGQLKCSTLTVDDSPQFSHRGLMIDTGRRFYPVPFVKSIVDGLAMSRMNVLHFHLSEECFRIESKTFPELTAPNSCARGNGNNTAFYTHADIADLVAYSRLRGVRVLPEFDMPGHSGGFCGTLTAAGLKCCGGQIEDDPAGKSAEMIGDLLAEMSSIFPDKVMNLGCDETGSSPPCTLANTKSFEVKMIEKLLSLGKTPMGWEEILFKTEAAADYPSVIVDSWARSSWSEAAAAGHPTVMSNSGIFYLDYPGHSAKGMWIDMMKGNSNVTQQKLLLGGEVSMWQDQYVGSCLFDNKQDENFTQSDSHCIWPRTAIAAGTFWGNYRPDVDDGWFNQTFVAVQARLGERKVDSCPCATLTSNGCSQMSFCGVGYCGPVPPPPGPPPPSCSAFAAPTGYGCMGETSGEPTLLLKPATNISGCSGKQPWACTATAAAACDALAGCVAFSIKNEATVSYFKAVANLPVPAAPTKQFAAVPCDPNDKNQAVVFKLGAGGVGQLVTANGLCADVNCDPQKKTAPLVAPLNLKPCVDGELGQQWKHLPGTAFQSQCGHACLDLYDGGRSDNAGLYTCAAGIWNQKWVPFAKTFQEVTNGKCLSDAPAAKGDTGFVTSADSTTWAKM